MRAGVALVLLGGLAAGVSPALAADEAGGGGATLIRPDPGLIVWTLVTFVLLLVLLRLFAWKPLLGAVEARERSIREAQEQARREREEAAGLLQEHRDLVAQARRERSEALAQGQRDAERIKAEILEEARRQKDELLRQADAQIEASLRQARGELRSATAEMAIRAAEKLLARHLDDAAQRKLVEEHLADLESTPTGSAAARS